MLQILVIIILALDVLLGSFSYKPIEPTKENISSWVEEMSPIFVDLGYGDKELTPYVRFQNLPYRGSTLAERSNAVRVCSKNLELSTYYKYKKNILYGTPDIVGTLTHEMAHMYQGVKCMRDDFSVERDATLNDIKVLKELSNNEFYKVALLWQLRELSITYTIDEYCKQNLSRDWIKYLSEDAQKRYGKLTCSSASERRPYTSVIPILIEEGFFKDLGIEYGK